MAEEPKIEEGAAEEKGLEPASEETKALVVVESKMSHLPTADRMNIHV